MEVQAMAKVLVIDDSRLVREKVRTTLEPAGYEVVTTELVIQIPELITTDPPELILLDLNMPGLSGKRVASLIRRFEKQPIPIVIYSSQPREELVATAKEIGAAGFVEKGAADGILTAAVNHALSINLWPTFRPATVS